MMEHAIFRGEEPCPNALVMWIQRIGDPQRAQIHHVGDGQCSNSKQLTAGLSEKNSVTKKKVDGLSWFSIFRCPNLKITRLGG